MCLARVLYQFDTQTQACSLTPVHQQEETEPVAPPHPVSPVSFLSSPLAFS